jgi:hypothetical protein
MCVRCCFVDLYALYMCLYLLLPLECSQIQSLNTCKRVGVSGHIPKLLGTWGLSTVNLGKSVSQERKTKERKFVWVETTIFSESSLCMENMERAINIA